MVYGTEAVKSVSSPALLYNNEKLFTAGEEDVFLLPIAEHGCGAALS